MRIDSELVRQVAQMFDLPGGAERALSGQSNEVWLGKGWVLRVGGDDDSLLTEAAVVTELPANVGYPRLFGAGRTSGRCWMVSERLAGDNLAAMWSRLSARDRLSALLNLWARVDAVHRTDVDRLPTLEPTPIYALTPSTAQQQIDHASATIGGRAADQLSEIVAAGLDELDRVELALVHSDAGLSNAVWDGHAAVPVDFEFACIAGRPRSREAVSGGGSQW